MATVNESYPFSSVLHEEINLIRVRRSVYREGTDVPHPVPPPPVLPPGRMSRIGASSSEFKPGTRGSKRLWPTDGSPTRSAVRSYPAPPGGDAAERAEKAAREHARGRESRRLGVLRRRHPQRTFNLGVLQGLAEFGLLKNFDYLSTVSGGGYIGSWFASWVKRERSLRNVEKRLQPPRGQSESYRTWEGKEPPAALSRTSSRRRNPSRFTTFKRTALSGPQDGTALGDTWVLIAIYLRNLLLNQLIILPATLVLILLTRYLIILYKPDERESWQVLFPGIRPDWAGTTSWQGRRSAWRLRVRLDILPGSQAQAGAGRDRRSDSRSSPPQDTIVSAGPDGVGGAPSGPASFLRS